MKEPASHPVVKWVGITISIILGAGLIYCLGDVCGSLWSLGQTIADSDRCYVGEETEGHHLFEVLPFDLPPQSDAGLPFIVNDYSFTDSSPSILFQASPQWIADFKARHGLQDTGEGMQQIDTCAGYLHLKRLESKKPETKRLLQGCTWKKLSVPKQPTAAEDDNVSFNICEAYVEEQKGYVLINFMLF